MPTSPSPAARDGLVKDWTQVRIEEHAALGIDTDAQPAALCLSGGGVRSAAFSLGVIQALAASGLLKHFHYLSTVSGGGYIGGWLTRRIAAESEACAGRGPPDDKASLTEIEKKVAGIADGRDCIEIHKLRRYTSFLAPRSGFASPDVWAGIMLWLRNTLVNWLVFAPLLIFVVSMPLAYNRLVAILAEAPADRPGSAWLVGAAGLLGLVALGWAIWRTILDLPTHAHPWRLSAPEQYGKTDGAVFAGIVLPAIIWCLAAPVAVAPMLHLQASEPASRAAVAGEPAHGTVTGSGVTVTVAVTAAASPDAPGPVGAVCPPAPDEPQDFCRTKACAALGPFACVEPRMIAGAILLLSLLVFAAAGLRVQFFAFEAGSDQRKLQTEAFVWNAPAWLAASAASAGLLWLGITLAAGQDLRWISVAGPPWVMLSEILRSTLYVAFRTRALRGDLDREWLARLNGSKVCIVATLAGIALIALVVQPVALEGVKSWLTVLAGGAASGTVAALVGKSAQTVFHARRKDGTRRIDPSMLANLAIVVFAAALVTAAAGATQALVRALIERVTGVFDTNPFDTPAVEWFGLQSGKGLDALVLDVSLGLAALWLAHKLADWINLNHFSMHAVYRNRLARAFLGTARPDGDRRPDRYAQFDPSDNVRMVDTFFRLGPGPGTPLRTARAPARLLPVINVALNSTAGPDTARAERQAKSFVITPLWCGSGELPGPGQSPEDGARKRGAFASTTAYAGHSRETGPGDAPRGITLAGAVAISGAAASPNMGYHSSPLIAFVMTLFNVRLGAWLPNPGAPSATADFLKRPDPDGLGPFLWDLAGRSSETDRYVYLSDGGHFDNLALYEMLRRRCRLMVVVDAGQDGGYGYADLRMAIQNAGIDLGVRLKFPDALKIGSDALDPFGTVATVVYPAVPAAGAPEAQPETDDPAFAGRGEEDGTILYLKPWLPEDCPTELRAFKALKASFPHESTGNQFFKESDFESYRALGAFIASKALDGYRADGPGRRPLRPQETEIDRLVAVLKR